MATDYDKALQRQLKRLPEIRAETTREILRLLTEAQQDITARLKKATPGSVSKMRQQQKEIRAAIERFGSAADAGMQRALGTSWRAGVELLVEPIHAAGAQRLGAALKINDRSLRAMRDLTTDKIKDISLRAVNRVNSELGGVILGTTPMPDAITNIQKTLGGATRQRAMTVAYSNVGMAYSAASYESMLAAERMGIAIAKRWMKSGKLHSRAGHVAAHNQIVRVSLPFLIADPKTGRVEELKFPRDPAASIANTINCGCMMVPVLGGSTFGASVIEIPGDPNQPIRKVSPAQREQNNREVIDRVNDRLDRFLESDQY